MSEMSEIIKEFVADYEDKQQALLRFLDDNGYVGGTMINGSSKVCFVRPTVGGGDVCVSISLDPDDGIIDIYSYDSISAARRAWVRWDLGNFVGEPTGWLRHLPSNRRRENGDPATETIRP